MCDGKVFLLNIVASSIEAAQLECSPRVLLTHFLFATQVLKFLGELIKDLTYRTKEVIDRVNLNIC